METKKIFWVSIIVAVVIIGVAVFFYTGSFNTLIGQEKPSPVSEQCQFACETNQKSAFCDVERKADNSVIATCNKLSTNSAYSKYNVQTCPSISCTLTAQELDKTCVTGLNSVWVTPTPDGICPAQDNKLARERSPSDNPPVTGQICCYYYE